ncbi:predicted protein [Histoplasma mississippiense (nom. inval.)]|uniref:predicted protein n=1 Tax=Ajellomyces capsulatus (strain NAm1 / WU24) TaxID=2059318 RepID=UPI000157C7E5|nr:predicted protein [Histoplasma mississippiense (nom. inval.)]EDN09569.1 predicted protein [Histoplasma mississippiense (nom. inval.)]
MRALLGHKKKGVVLLISSIAGLDGVVSKPLYAAAKHAIVGFVRSMSVAEQQFGIKGCGDLSRTGEVSKVVYKGFENDPGNTTAIETLPCVRLVGKQMRKQMERYDLTIHKMR